MRAHSGYAAPCEVWTSDNLSECWASGSLQLLTPSLHTWNAEVAWAGRAKESSPQPPEPPGLRVESWQGRLQAEDAWPEAAGLEGEAGLADTRAPKELNRAGGRAPVRREHVQFALHPYYG